MARRYVGRTPIGGITAVKKPKPQRGYGQASDSRTRRKGGGPSYVSMDSPEGRALSAIKPKKRSQIRATQSVAPPGRRGGFAGGLVSYTDISKVK